MARGQGLEARGQGLEVQEQGLVNWSSRTRTSLRTTTLGYIEGWLNLVLELFQHFVR